MNRPLLVTVGCSFLLLFGCRKEAQPKPQPPAPAATESAQIVDTDDLPGAARPVTLSQADNGKHIAVRVGRKIVVTLDGNPTTGYAWVTASVEGDSVRQVGKVEYQPDQQDEPRIGGGGKFTVTFEAVRAGDARVTLEYRRPWEKDEPPAETLKFAAEVR